MRVFRRLRALRAFEKQHLGFLETVEDHNLICEIGYHQLEGRPLTLKQLFLLDAGSIATVQRRLRRLRELGLIQQRRSHADRRAVELTLTPKCVRAYTKYAALLAVEKGDAPGHACGLYDSEQGRRALALAFVSEGLRQGDRCVVIGGRELREAIAAGARSHAAHGTLVLIEEYEQTADAQLALWRRVFAEARAARQTVRVVGDAAWALSRMSAEQLIDYEKRLEPLTRQARARVLCLYDARAMSGPDLLRTLRAHSDTASQPLAVA
jgi:DNA-binding MarR family transcriptional regulator